MQTLRRCNDCITANTESIEETEREYIDPSLEQYLDYCGIRYMTTTITGFRQDGSPTTAVFLLETMEAISTIESTISSTTSSQATRGETSSFPSETGSRSSSPDDTDSGSKSWIAGPVIGSFFAVGLLLGLIIWLRRRKKQRSASTVREPVDESYGKAQLHSDDLPKPVYPLPELHPESIHEMEGSHPEFHQAEKPANEAPARELPNSQSEMQRE